MSKQQISGSKQDKIKLYNYGRIISRTFVFMQKDLSERLVTIHDIQIVVSHYLTSERPTKNLNSLPGIKT